MAGDRAYKAKKPVLTDFIDFRGTDQRERACHREVELNSRLSAGSYLGVAHLSDPAGGPAEPIVVMRRYRDSDRLACLVNHPRSAAASKTALDAVDSVASVLAAFHDGAQRSRAIGAQGESYAIEKRWRENIFELWRYAAMNISGVTDEVIGRIDQLVAEFISGRSRLFARRIAEENIIDGHGDLLADDIFVMPCDGPGVLGTL